MATIYSDYDSMIRAACPNYGMFLKSIVNSLSLDTKDVVNLGTGSGNLEKQILLCRPNVKIYGIDINPELLDLAKSKLKGYNFVPVQGDMFNVQWPECDTIVSSITIHHFDHLKQEELFKRVHSHLPKAGIFLNYDYVMPKTEQDRKRVYDKINDSLLKYGLSEDAIQSLKRETEENDHPMPLEKQKNLLMNLGFDFELICEKSSFVLYKCIK